MVPERLPQGSGRIARYIVRFCRIACYVFVVGFGYFTPTESSVQELTIESAVDLARFADPQISAHRLQAEAQDKLSSAATQLPSPTVRTGFLNVPLDSFALHAEPMTQTLIGIRQMIPPQGTRSARSLNHEQLRESFNARASLASKNTVRDTRTTWLEAHYLRQEIELTAQALLLLENLSDVVRARYATGDELQLAVIASELELNRLKSRLIDTQRREFEVLTHLQRLTGVADQLTISAELPNWRAVPRREHVMDSLPEHPRIQIIDSLIAAENAKVQLSESEFKPEWHIDLSYGIRDGLGFEEESRSDFASATISFSLPFAVKRQRDLRLRAAQADEDAARQTRLDVVRNMKSNINVAYSDWRWLSERTELLDEAIVPQTNNHAQAALKAYQNKEGSFADVLLSYVNEVDAKLEQHRVRIDRLKAWATIDSLNGSTK